MNQILIYILVAVSGVHLTSAASFRRSSGNFRRSSEIDNYIENYDIPQSTQCCVIPTCNEKDNCFETISCGYICSKGIFKSAPHMTTPGYRLKESYSKYECHFGECKEYKFLCSSCPDPSHPDFNMHAVRKDCLNCYY
ncbi:unnamed protein product [Acanthoscelides obtectus]|uniref:Uncharacterized protein n=1 Tax=Acanthoscelides obtectus TaxID=200917 RepID=A0A9P0M3C3_ACAOB|nr:unnamed protein product [Acanthoscelides obtectus]CAK1638557.1 hypothetical protein AOBTE_LOCUS10664 [Acanthoscelides obtectus]